MKAALNLDTLESRRNQNDIGHRDAHGYKAKQKIPTPGSFMKRLEDFENFQVWPEVCKFN